MNSAELIGRVGAEYLRDRVKLDERSDELEGTARFILDSLSPEQTRRRCQHIASRSPGIQGL